MDSPLLELGGTVVKSQEIGCVESSAAMHCITLMFLRRNSWSQPNQIMQLASLLFVRFRKAYPCPKDAKACSDSCQNIDKRLYEKCMEFSEKVHGIVKGCDHFSITLNDCCQKYSRILLVLTQELHSNLMKIRLTSLHDTPILTQSSWVREIIDAIGFHQAV